MILIEHTTVLTLDRERRILADGSILVDGRDIVQVGPTIFERAEILARQQIARAGLAVESKWPVVP